MLISPFRSKARLQAENAELRQQLIVLRRKCRGRVRLTYCDRLLFVQLYRWFPSILQVLHIIRHLRRVLRAYASYYNGVRTHRSLNKDAPVHRPTQRIGILRSHPILGGLHHQYVRI